MTSQAFPPSILALGMHSPVRKLDLPCLTFAYSCLQADVKQLIQEVADLRASTWQLSQKLDDSPATPRVMPQAGSTSEPCEAAGRSIINDTHPPATSILSTDFTVPLAATPRTPSDAVASPIAAKHTLIPEGLYAEQRVNVSAKNAAPPMTSLILDAGKQPFPPTLHPSTTLIRWP